MENFLNLAGTRRLVEALKDYIDKLGEVSLETTRWVRSLPGVLEPDILYIVGTQPPYMLWKLQNNVPENVGVLHGIDLSDIPDRPANDSTGHAANTRFVQNAIGDGIYKRLNLGTEINITNFNTMTNPGTYNVHFMFAINGPPSNEYRGILTVEEMETNIPQDYHRKYIVQALEAYYSENRSTWARWCKIDLETDEIFWYNWQPTDGSNRVWINGGWAHNLWLSGTPWATNPALTDNSTRIATTHWTRQFITSLGLGTGGINEEIGNWTPVFSHPVNIEYNVYSRIGIQVRAMCIFHTQNPVPSGQWFYFSRLPFYPGYIWNTLIPIGKAVGSLVPGTSYASRNVVTTFGASLMHITDDNGVDIVGANSHISGMITLNYMLA